MSTFAGALKDEIRRLARKEIKTETAVLKKASAQHRRDIAGLKRSLQAQERRIASLYKSAAQKTFSPAPGGSDQVPAIRFSPAWLANHREKLELSAADYAMLVGVSPLTIYNWEKGKTRPRTSQLVAWSKIRNLGKREAWKLLEEME